MKSKPLTVHKENYFPAQWDFLTNKKKARIKAGSGEKRKKVGQKGRPTAKNIKNAAKKEKKRS